MHVRHTVNHDVKLAGGKWAGFQKKKKYLRDKEKWFVVRGSVW